RRAVAVGRRLVEPAHSQVHTRQAQMSVDRVPGATVFGQAVLVMAGRGVEVLLKQRDLTEAVEHDANSPLVSQLAGNGQILGKGPGGLDVASPEQVGPAQGTQGDRLAETIAQLAL